MVALRRVAGSVSAVQDPGATVWKITLAVFAIVLVVCVAAGLWNREAIVGGFALRGAQTRFEERVRGAVDPTVTIDYSDSSERSAALTITVPRAVFDDEASRAKAFDDVWTAYAEEFAGGGMPIDRIFISTSGAGESLGVGDLAARTGVPAPPLHAMYAEQGYFDASQEAVPGDAGTGE